MKLYRQLGEVIITKADLEAFRKATKKQPLSEDVRGAKVEFSARGQLEGIMLYGDRCEVLDSSAWSDLVLDAQMFFGVATDPVIRNVRRGRFQQHGAFPWWWQKGWKR